MKKTIFLIVALILVITLAVPATVYVARAAVGTPTFSIVSVITDQKVTIQTDSFPADRDFVVRMGAIGSLGIGGTQVATTNSGGGGSFQVTYTIPDALKGSALISIRLDSTTGGYFAYNWFTNSTSGSTPAITPVPGTGGPVYTGIPTFEIIGLGPDAKVTIQTDNFPENYNFVVRMGAMGTLGIGGIQVGTVNSGAGGSFQATFDIPASLTNSASIAIRMDSTTGGFYAYNWFTNATGGGTTTPGTGGTGGTGGAVYTGIPTFSIVSVDPDKSVTIQTTNYPQNYDFVVRMGAFGTKAIGGVNVGTSNSGAGGSFQVTYTIPASLQGSRLIAIRMDSTVGGFYAYNWFDNMASGSSGVGGMGGIGGPVYTGIPTISISAVAADSSVTILTNNFPQGYDFNVLMGAFGTAGVGGTQVGTLNSGAGGSMTQTFNIPDALKGSSRIAIRLVSTTGGFFAYNWFWNSTAP